MAHSVQSQNHFDLSGWICHRFERMQCSEYFFLRIPFRATIDSKNLQQTLLSSLFLFFPPRSALNQCYCLNFRSPWLYKSLIRSLCRISLIGGISHENYLQPILLTGKVSMAFSPIWNQDCCLPTKTKMHFPKLTNPVTSLAHKKNTKYDCSHANRHLNFIVTTRITFTSLNVKLSFF